jgi:uncharacterized membrane protein HdeD (DUF308 family)
MSAISDVFKAAIQEVRKTWGWFLTLGILLMVLGVLCIVKAQTATGFSILALGWVLMISAVFWFVGAFLAFDWSLFFLCLLTALLGGAAGYLLVRHPEAGAEGVTMVLAVLFIVGGLYRTIAAGVIRFPLWGLMVLSGLVGVGLGIYIIMHWSSASPYLFGIVIGVDLIFDAAALIGFAAALRRLPAA